MNAREEDERKGLLTFVCNELVPFVFKAPLGTEKIDCTIKTNIHNYAFPGLLAYCSEESRIILRDVGFEEEENGEVNHWRLSEKESDRLDQMVLELLKDPSHNRLMDIILDFKLTIWDKHLKDVRYFPRHEVVRVKKHKKPKNSSL